MGVIAVPLLAMMIRMAARQEVMGEFAINTTLQILGWTATALMALSVVGMGILALW